MKQVTVHATQRHRDQAQAFSDPMWTLLETSSADEIDTWLGDNVKGVADVRPLIRAIILALRFFIQQQQSSRP